MGVGIMRMSLFVPEESIQFRFFHTVCLPNLEGSVGLNLTKASDIRISIPVDLSCVHTYVYTCIIVYI